MLGVNIAYKTFIGHNPDFADEISERTLLKYIAGEGIKLPGDYYPTNPIAERTAAGIQNGQIIGGNGLGFITALVGTIAGASVALATLGPAVFGLAAAALLTTGAVANVAAPVVLGLLGKRDDNEEGLCAKIGIGMIDSVWTPIMGMAYIGSRVGQAAGILVGGLLGGAWGVARHYSIQGYNHVIKPYLECAPVQQKLASAGKTVDAITTRVAACPLPDYSNNANAFGQRLRARFTGMSGAANANKPAQPAQRTGTQGPQDPDSGFY